MQKCYGSPKKLFSARNQIFDHFWPKSWPYCEKSKIIKIAILAKISIFHKVSGIGRDDDIWQEMDSLGVLEQFCTWIRYLNTFRSYFKLFRKNRFFEIFHLWVWPKSASQKFLRVSKFRNNVGNLFRALKAFTD